MNLYSLEYLQSQIGRTTENSPSPVGRWLQGTLRAVEEGRMRVDFTVREEMTNPFGVLHGGMVATMLDEVLGITVATLGHEHFYTTVNLHIDYLSSARLGEVITVESEIIRKGRNIIHAECRMSSATGKLLAKAATNLIETGIRKVNAGDKGFIS